MKKLLSLMISAGLGLWLATIFVAGVSVVTSGNSAFFGLSLSGNWKFFILFGVLLGLLNYFVKPILNIITLPLRIITLGLFGFLINMILIWLVDVIFVELSVPWLLPLAWATLITWGLNVVFSKLLLRNKD